jgi:hypothetical protein
LTILDTELALHCFLIKPRQELLHEIQHNSNKDNYNILLQWGQKGYVHDTDTMKEGKDLFRFLQQKSFYVDF